MTFDIIDELLKVLRENIRQNEEKIRTRQLKNF